MKVDGRCLCGYLTYEAEVDPDEACICHCTDCQTRSGSAFRISVPVIDAHLTFTTGTPKTFVKIAESGNRRELGFCPECGTSVFTRPEGNGPGYFGLRVGSLRQRHELVPKSQHWRPSALAWVDHIRSLHPDDKDGAPAA